MQKGMNLYDCEDFWRPLLKKDVEIPKKFYYYLGLLYLYKSNIMILEDRYILRVVKAVNPNYGVIYGNNSIIFHRYMSLEKYV
jgi:hypothetical protein